MISQIFLFEFKSWIRNKNTYIYLLISTLLGFLITNYYGHALNTGIYVYSSIKTDSAFSINNKLSLLSLAITMIVSLIMGMAVYKDFLYNTFSITFSSTSSKFNYLIGRFFGAFAISLLIVIGPYLGFYAGIIVPWTSDFNFGASKLYYYIFAFIFKTLPLIFFASALFFSLSTLLKNTIFNWIVVILIFGLSSFTTQIYGDKTLESYHYLMALIDPLANVTDMFSTEGFSGNDINTKAIPLTNVMLFNRLIYISIGLFVLAFTYFKINLFAKQTKFSLFGFFKKKTIQEKIDYNTIFKQISLPKMTPDFGLKTQWRLWLRVSLNNLFRILRNPFLIFIMMIAFFYANASDRNLASAWGTNSYPLTYIIVGKYINLLNLFVILTITWFCGELIWRDRRYRVNQIMDSYPISNLFLISSKLLALLCIPLLYYIMVVVLVIKTQIALDFHQHDYSIFITELTLTYIYHIIFTIFTLLLFALIHNKYMAIILVILYYFLNIYLINDLIPHKMLSFMNSPGYVYSDLTGYSGSLFPHTLFKFYWLAFSGMLIYFISKVWPRGLDLAWKNILKKMKKKGTKAERYVFRISAIVFAILGIIIFYNIYALGNGRIPKQKDSANYEKKHNYLKDLALPKITDVFVELDLYPESKSYEVKGYYWLKNKTDKPIKKLVANFNSNYEVKKFTFSKKATKESSDPLVGLNVYLFDTPIMPKDSVKLSFNFRNEYKGFSNEGLNLPIAENGTFLRNSTLLPSFGYNSRYEIKQNEIRELYDLEPTEIAPPSHNDPVKINNSMLCRYADFVNFEAIISTKKDEIAIAPGYLQKKWEDKNRMYYHYKMDKPIQNFYSFTSGKYEIKKENYKGISLEIYYHKTHHYNIDKMMDALKKSFDYFTKHFSPYQYKQLRIIEFPRTLGGFAQSLSNTVPFSESIGFIADLRKIKYGQDTPSDTNPSMFDFQTARRDIPLYVTAHEVAHQWWAHQIMSGDVEGSNFLIETMAQYGALMVVEEEYGIEKAKDYVRHELESYLRARSFESIKEEPLIRIRPEQQYIHYNKGAVVMYALRTYLGKATMDSVLSSFIKENAYKQNPYSHAGELYKELRSVAPDSLKYIVDDWLDDITFYDNKVIKATYKRNEDFDYEIDFELEINKYRDDGFGNETKVPINDYVTILIYNSEGIEIHKERLKIRDTSKKTYSFVVSRKPDFITIDPSYNLIDKILRDNTIRFERKEDISE